MPRLIVTCPRCKREYTYIDLKDIENFLHWGDTSEHRKVMALDGQSYMFCNECYKQYKIFEAQTNNDIKEKFKNFMNVTLNAQNLHTFHTGK